MSNPAKVALQPVEIESLPWDEWSEGVRYAGRTRTLSPARAAGLKIGVHIEELPAGKQSCPFHYHLLEEEHIWMLAGELTLRLGDERIALRAGQFVTFPAGAQRGHCMINESQTTARYLIIGDHQRNEVAIYPDSGKVMLRGFGGSVHELGPRADYWQGEHKDEPLCAAPDQTRGRRDDL